MKLENIPADIKSKSLKEAREEIDTILSKLEICCQEPEKRNTILLLSTFPAFFTRTDFWSEND